MLFLLTISLMSENPAFNPQDKIEVGVIGAGAVGLSIARSLAQEGREVIVFEAEREHGMHTSSRNSEVIHSGIYYRPGSLKARLSVKGKNLLYEYCDENDIPNKKIGKLLIINREDSRTRLEQFRLRGQANGVNDLVILDEQQVRELEPNVRSVGAIYSSSTGIFDSHKYMVSLKRDITKSKSWVQVSSPVLEGKVRDNGIALSIGGKNPATVLCDVVINSAGLFAQDVARSIDGLLAQTIPDRYLAKGHYFTLKGRSPFSHLVYPLPEPGGLGIHVTLDMENRVRFGPDVDWVEDVDYSFDESRITSFYESVRSYYPDLRDGDLQPGYTGIRPKLARKAFRDPDFIIQGAKEHGIAGLVNLYGIESPGLTASLAIGEYVKNLLKAD